MTKMFKILQEKLKFLIENNDNIEHLLSAPEILADKKLTKYYLKLIQENKEFITLAKKCFSLLEILQEDRELVSDELIIILEQLIISYNKKRYSKCNIEIESSHDIKEWIKGAIESIVNHNGFKLEVIDNIITVEGIGAFGAFVYLAGSYSIDGKKAYIYVFDEEESVEFNEDRVKIDIFRASKKGGQNVNKVESAIRATYMDTNDVVICQDERSQLQNKERAIEKLKELVINNINSNNKKCKKETKKLIRKEPVISIQRQIDQLLVSWLNKVLNVFD